LHEQFLLFVSFLGRFGGLSTGAITFVNRLDDTDGNGLPHISDGESSKWSVGGERLDAHWLGWFEFDNSGITGFDLRWVVFNFFTGSSIDLFFHLVESASDVSSVAIEDWSVTFLDLTWVVQDDDLGIEGLGLSSWVFFRVRADITSSDVFNGDVLDVESDVVTRDTFGDGFVVHFDGFDFSGDVGWSEGADHTGFDDSGFDSADWHRSDTTDLVDVLEWESEGFVGWSTWWDDGVEGFEESFTGLFATFFGLFSPTFVPGHVFGSGDHVVSVPSGNWDESDGFWVVTDFLDVRRDFLDDFFESVFGVFWFGVVHLVNSNDELFDTEGKARRACSRV